MRIQTHGGWALDGASYEIKHLRHSNKTDKKHASNLSPYPYPVELIAFEPLDGTDNQYGQLYKPISAERFDDAGLKGFLPSKLSYVTRLISVANVVRFKQRVG
jgi:hypothetical protein